MKRFVLTVALAALGALAALSPAGAQAPIQGELVLITPVSASSPAASSSGSPWRGRWS